MADFAVAMGGGQIQTGSACRGERIAKYNRLLKSRGLLALLPYSNPHSNWRKRRETDS
jgi:enolase